MDVRFVTFLTFSLLAKSAWATQPLLIAQTPLIIPGKPGKFDFMAVDSSKNRLLAAHKGTGKLAQLDLTQGRVLAEIDVGSPQGIAVDEEAGIYYVGNETQHDIAVIDAKTGVKVASIPVHGPVDAMTLNPKLHRLYACHDESAEVWVVDTISRKVVATISIPGVPETIAYDSASDSLYQSLRSNKIIHSKSEIAIISPKTNVVSATWSTLPASSLFGLAIDQISGHLFAAGANGKLVAMDLKTGKRTAMVDIPIGVDQIAFDAKTKRIYCISRDAIVVVSTKSNTLVMLGTVATPGRSYGIAIAPETQSVWIAYADTLHSYLQEFKISL